MSQRASAPSEKAAFGASALFHALALLTLGAVVQPWTPARASARPADAWIETELRVEDRAVEAVASVASSEHAPAPAPGRPARPTRSRARREAAQVLSSDDVIALTTSETDAASPSLEDATGGGDGTLAARVEPEPAPEPPARCGGDPIAGLWHGFAVRTMASYRREDDGQDGSSRDWFFHADVFLWIRRAGASLQGASMVHEWSSATRTVTDAPCGSRDFDRTLWMGMEGELEGLALRMRSTASAANVMRAGACGERRFVEAGTSELRRAGRGRFEVQRVADDELTGLYRWNHYDSDLQLTRQACIGDVRWPRW